MTRETSRSYVRWNKEEGWFELRCDSCISSNQMSGYWPLTLDEKGRPEHWVVSNGLRKCRACVNKERRMARRLTPEEKRAKQRAYYRRRHTERLAWVHEYRDRNRERINALRRAAYARRVAAQRAAVGEQLGAFDE